MSIFTVALHTAAPGNRQSESEVKYPGYERRVAEWTDGVPEADGVAFPEVAVGRDFPESGEGVTVATHCSVVAPDGEIYLVGELAPKINCMVGVTPKIYPWIKAP